MSVRLIDPSYHFSSKGIRVGGYLTATFVIAEGFIRYQSTKTLQKYEKPRKIELVAGGTFLGLTLLCSAYQAPMGLWAITLVTVRRLYCDFRMIPCVEDSTLPWPDDWDSVIYFVLENCVNNVLLIVFFVSKQPTPWQLQCFSQLAFLVCYLESKYLNIEEGCFGKMVEWGLFKGTTPASIALETERLWSLFTTLRGLTFWLVASNCVSSMVNFEEGA
jgi:hypothetical protein